MFRRGRGVIMGIYYGSASAGSATVIGSTSTSFARWREPEPDEHWYDEPEQVEVIHEHVYIEPTWTCEYCGQERRGLTCSGCGASIPGDVYD